MAAAGHPAQRRLLLNTGPRQRTLELAYHRSWLGWDALPAGTKVYVLTVSTPTSNQVCELGAKWAPTLVTP